MKKTQRIWPQRLIWITLAVVVVFFGARVYYRLTDDFRIANMTYEVPHHPEWEVPSFTKAERKKFEEILSQPFSYVGKGAQSYVFVSQDKKHVIKFFKFKHLKPKWWVDALPAFPYFKEYRERQNAKKLRQLNGVFTGYKLAYDVHKEQSGIVFIHLNKTNDLNVNVTLIDKIGRKHLLDLDPIVFVIQENAKTSRTVMNEALKNGDIALAKKRITQIFNLYLEEYRKGIYDRDHGVMHNTGFVGDKPIHLDVGKLTRDNTMRQRKVYRPDLEKIGRKFEVWLQEQYPEAHPELTKFIEEKFSEIFGEKYSFSGS